MNEQRFPMVTKSDEQLANEAGERAASPVQGESAPLDQAAQEVAVLVRDIKGQLSNIMGAVFTRSSSKTYEDDFNAALEKLRTMADPNTSPEVQWLTHEVQRLRASQPAQSGGTPPVAALRNDAIRAGIVIANAAAKEEGLNAAFAQLDSAVNVLCTLASPPSAAAGPEPTDEMIEAAVAWQLLNARGEIIGQSHVEEEVTKRRDALNKSGTNSAGPFTVVPLYRATPSVACVPKEGIEKRVAGWLASHRAVVPELSFDKEVALLPLISVALGDEDWVWQFAGGIQVATARLNIYDALEALAAISVAPETEPRTPAPR